MPEGRAILVGRACGLAAGTVLACGSVLAGATQVGDGSLAKDGATLPNPTPTAPVAGSGTPDVYPAKMHTQRASAAPDSVSAQALDRTSRPRQARLGQVHRNNPVSVDVPAEPSRHSRTAQGPWDSSPPAADRSPTSPVRPVLDPAASEVGRVAPVDGVLPSEGRAASPGEEQMASPRKEQRTDRSTIRADVPVKRVVAPVKNATQPAMAMLTSVLPKG
ncbi:MAG: hypothetical protein M3460_17125 [Actinomycetota bacterium]|nr:hypothetical protein [Actinomycetota bacterium]